MTAKIMCSVNNCHYWYEGNVCEASSILVTSDGAAKHNPESVDAMQAQTMSVTPVNQCQQTCCKTFVDQQSAEIDVDRVTKSRS